MNRFNLTFSGEILAGQDQAQVKQRFARLFGIDDPVRLERFFSGETIILRRNLERKAAAQSYHELHLLGVVAELVKVTASEAAAAIVNTPPTPGKKPARQTKVSINRTGPIKPELGPKDETSDRSRAVSSSAAAQADQQRRVAAQETARKEAERLEKERRGAGEVARREAIAAEARRKSAEEAARKEAERLEIKQREEEAEARKKALQAEARRKESEEAARRKARRAQRKAERAQLKAEAAAQRKAEEEEVRRRKAEEAARRQAQLEEIRLREAQEAARLQAELDELKRQEAEEAARLQAELDEITRQEAKEAARLQAEHEERERQEAAEAARIKAEAQRRQEEAQRQSAERRRAAAEELERKRAQRKETLTQQEEATLIEPLRDTAEQRPASEPAHQVTRRPARALARTSLEVPQRSRGKASGASIPGQRKRQPGEPNLYKLRPFRNTDEVRDRASVARQRMRQSYTVGAIALATLLLAAGSFFQFSAHQVITGTSAIAISPQSGPLLLAGDSLLMHDRAGIGTSEISLSALGLSTLQAPLAFDGDGALFALGRLVPNSTEATTGDTLQLLRCKLTASSCKVFSQDLTDSSIGAFTINALDGSVLLADISTGQLLKANREGQIVARAAAPIPDQPVLRLHSGLLLMNSAAGPAISVFRYEDSAFGRQLDEILLLPPSALEAEQSVVGDFLWSGNNWWASLRNPQTGSIGLYRFDEEWNFLEPVAVPADAGDLQLTSWGTKTLVNDPMRHAIQRYNAQGEVESPFVSAKLGDLIAAQQQRATLSNMTWRGTLLLCALVATLGFGAGYLQSLRALVYQPRRERGAEPVDDYIDALHWVDPVQNRPALLRRTGLSFCLLLLAALLVAMGQSVTVWQLAALLLALSGPIIALLLLSRHPVGHIGIIQDRLLLVDHRGMYHLAGGSSVQYRGPFLLIDDVVVFWGNRLLPAFSLHQVQALVMPLAMGGVKVDRNTVLVKLLQCRHPLAQGAFAIMGTLTGAALLLCLHGLF